MSVSSAPSQKAAWLRAWSSLLPDQDVEDEAGEELAQGRLRLGEARADLVRERLVARVAAPRLVEAEDRQRRDHAHGGPPRAVGRSARPAATSLPSACGELDLCRPRCRRGGRAPSPTNSALTTGKVSVVELNFAIRRRPPSLSSDLGARAADRAAVQKRLVESGRERNPLLDLLRGFGQRGELRRAAPHPANAARIRSAETWKSSAPIRSEPESSR